MQREPVRSGDGAARKTARLARRPARPGAPPSVVALGGGHGLYASLSALRRVTRDLTAVVTVADDGGSQRPAAPRVRRAAAR